MSKQLMVRVKHRKTGNIRTITKTSYELRKKLYDLLPSEEMAEKQTLSTSGANTSTTIDANSTGGLLATSTLTIDGVSSNVENNETSINDAGTASTTVGIAEEVVSEKPKKKAVKPAGKGK